MPNKVIVGYSARPKSNSGFPSLYLAPSPTEIPNGGLLACEMMSAAEERRIIDGIDSFMINLQQFIPSQIFTWEGSDLSPIMVLDLKSMMTEWALYARAIPRFIGEHEPSTVIVEESADRPWLKDLVRYLIPNSIIMETSPASIKARLERALAPSITRRRGLPISGRPLPERVDYLILLQNAYTDLSNLAPVITALNGKNTLVLATDPEASAACQARNYNYCAPGDFGQPDKTDERLFCRFLEDDIGKVPLSNEWQVDADVKLPLRDLFLRHFPYLPGAYLFQMHRFYKFVERALLRLKPGLVFLAQDAMRAGSAICAAAEKLHIPTLCLQHGVTGASDHGYLPVHATKLATWGQYSTDFLIAHGGDAARISPCGCTYIQPLVEEYRSGKAPSQPEKIITLFTNPSGMAHQREMITAFANVHPAFPEYKFRVKIHPAERDYTYSRFIQATNLKLWESKDTPAIIKKSALSVIFSSGVGLDAMLLRRPVLTMNFTGGRDNLGAGEIGAAAYVTDPTGLEEGIRTMISNDQPEMMNTRQIEFLKLYFRNLTDDPVVKVLELGKELVKDFAKA
jgi:hypothetical protein